MVHGTASFEDYFNSTQHGNKTLKDYVSTTDQQSQSVQGLMRASEEARDQQIAQNNAIIQGAAAAKASQAAMKGLALAGNILAPMLIGSAISQIAGWIDDIVHRSDHFMTSLVIPKPLSDILIYSPPASLPNSRRFLSMVEFNEPTFLFNNIFNYIIIHAANQIKKVQFCKTLCKTTQLK